MPWALAVPPARACSFQPFYPGSASSITSALSQFADALDATRWPLPSPKPRPGILDIEAYVPGESACRAVSSRSSCRRTRRRSGRARRPSRPSRVRRRDSSAIPTARRALRQAIARRYGLDAGAHRVRRRLRRAASACSRTPISGPATRRSTPSTAFSSTASSSSPTARRRSWRRSASCTTDVDAILAG